MLDRMPDIFQKAYEKLNPEQKEAVDSIEGPVMVVAGPGTGKTQLLTLRIANILRQTDTTPGNILALTFTESAVVSMRRRLAELIGSPAYGVRIATFHSFCNEIIQQYPEAFPRIIGATHISEVDQIGIIEAIIAEAKLNVLKPFGDPAFYVRPALSAIRKLKQEGMGPKQFTEIVSKEHEVFDAAENKVYTTGKYIGRMKGVWQEAEKRLTKAKELTEIFTAYEKVLQVERLYDYEDMIGEVVTTLEKDPDMLLILQEQYQYLLVDEHQDTNNAQNKLLELLASFHKQPNLFVVGDVKQAIFRFQGASLENFAYFKKRYPSAELVVLSKNYRSQQSILDAAEELLPGQEPLRATGGLTPERFEVAAFSNPETEAYGVANEVKSLLEEGTEPREIAVLYRDNRDAFPIAAMLERMGLPFQIESNQDVLADQEIKKLIVLLRAAQGFGDERVFSDALHVDFLDVHPLDIAVLLDARKTRNMSLYHLAKSEKILDELGLENPAAVHEAYRQLAQWSRIARNKSLPEVVEIIIRESGFLSHIVAQDDPAEQLDRLTGFFAEVTGLVERKRNATLSDFIAYLDTLGAHGILVRAARTSALANRVRLMTAHRSKGLEFDVVIITGVVDGHWGNKRRRELLPLPSAVYALSNTEVEEGSSLDDERRLFYVAMTRARHRVLVTYAREASDGRERLPSVFLEEIGADRLTERNTRTVEDLFMEDRDIVFAPRIRSGADIKDTTFIKELFARRGLSVTALNNYLNCPWRYFYRNLLRVPEAPSKHQMLGIAVHEALRRFFTMLGDASGKNEPDKAFLLRTFTHALQQQPLTEEDLAASLERGETALAGYFDTYRTTWHTATKNEFTIAGVLLPIRGGEVRLTGKLDKLELFSGGIVDVVDYKTGRQKSRNVIEGKTKGSRGDIKRQLVFYQLLLDRYEDKRYTMRDGIIDFVEPDTRGKYRQERFTVMDEEVKELETVITDVASEITSLAFWGNRCDDKTCRYCGLRDML